MNNKSIGSLDMNHVLQDIFADKNTFDSKFLKYERVKEDFQNEEKNHIYNHYKTFIRITEELKNVQGSVEKMKQFFFEYEPLLNSLRETLKDEELAKQASKRTNTINRQIFDLNIENEEDDLDSNEVLEDIQRGVTENSSLNARNRYDLTDRLNEVIDKFDLSIYEKNYTESIKIYRLFKEMKKSKKYSEIILGYEIRKNIDFHYNRLVESLISDIFSETTKNFNDIIKFLIEIGQLHKAKLAVLSIRSKQLQEKIKSLIDDNKEHDELFFETITKEFFDEAVSCLKFIQETFKDPSQGNSCMSSFSTWVNSEIHNFYAIMAPYVYESDDLQIAIYYLKKICMILMEKQSEGISLSTEFQKLTLHDIQDSLDELCKNLIFNLKTSVTGEDYNLYSFFSIINVLEYDIEIIETASLIDIDRKNNPRFSINNRGSLGDNSSPQNDGDVDKHFFDNISEAYIDRNVGEIIIQTDLDLKLTRSMNYFWNTFFFLIDLAYEAKDTDNIPVISSQFFSLIQFKLESLFESLFKAYFEILDEKVSKTENQALSYLTSLYYSKVIADSLDKILLFKFPKLYKKNSSWQTLSTSFAKKYEESIGLFTKMTVLDKVSPAIIRNAQIYTKKEAKIFVDKPTAPFLELAKVFEQANKNFDFLIGPKQKERVLYHMFYSCFLCIDYTVLCLENPRRDEKDQQTQLFDKAVLERFKIDYESIQMLMFRNSFKLTDCTSSGLYQFIYDVNFLSMLYQKLTQENLPEGKQPSLVINTDSLLERLIAFFAKEKNIKAESIKFKREIFQKALDQFFETGYNEQSTSQS